MKNPLYHIEEPPSIKQLFNEEEVVKNKDLVMRLTASQARMFDKICATMVISHRLAKNVLIRTAIHKRLPPIKPTGRKKVTVNLSFDTYQMLPTKIKVSTINGLLIAGILDYYQFLF